MLDFIDETLHQMALAIPSIIVFLLLFGLLMRRNHDFYALCKQAVHKRLSRIAPIRNIPLNGKAFCQLRSLIDVVSLPRTQFESSVVPGLSFRL